MKMNARGSWSMKFVGRILGMTLALTVMGLSAWGQTGDNTATEKGSAVSNARVDTRPFQTFYLTNVSQQADANEIMVAIRNLLPPDIKVVLVPAQNAIAMRGTADELQLTQKIINDFDRPKKIYRLTYTIAESDGGKRVGVQHFSMIVASGGRTTLKQGSKVPIVTGTYNPGSSSAQNQMTYLDVGMNFDASLDEFVDGVRLRTKVEQSGIAEEKSGVGAQDPIVRQTVLEGTSILVPGKPLTLGSLDVPGSTRHLEIEVVLEAVR